MHIFTNQNAAARLNAHELLQDYTRKLNAACPLAMVHHEQDESGATLVVYIPSGSVDAVVASVRLSGQLKKLVGSLPAPIATNAEPVQVEQPQTAGGEMLDESQKAVVSPLAQARKPRKNAKANEQASDESSPSGT